MAMLLPWPKKPYFDLLTQRFPTFLLQAAGESVGLPWGEMGNSEVGHLHIGAGKIVYQDLLRINKSILDGNFFSNEAFLKLAKDLVSSEKSLHLIGLVSSGGVHSHQDHLFALLDFCKKNNLSKVFIHAILDGRDSSYNSAYKYISDLQKQISEVQVGQIASLTGRFWSMDRDNNWDRVEKAYRAMAGGVAEYDSSDPLKAIKESYQRNVFDEQFEPTIIKGESGPVGQIKDGDSVIFFNFRSDRARQLTKSLSDEKFDDFQREYLKLNFVTMTEYESDLPVSIAFQPVRVNFPLAHILSEAGLLQLHIAETEKYAHVTYFLNGGREEPYSGEEHILIPSPSVSSYDEKPYMSARKIRERVIQEINVGKFDVYFVNFANADMIGHTGNLKATVEAIQVLDECLQQICDEVLNVDGSVLITADHGNAEGIINLTTGDINKEHSATPVPFIVINKKLLKADTEVPAAPPALHTFTPAGVLADVAPTMLKILNLEKHQEMTGRSLI